MYVEYRFKLMEFTCGTVITFTTNPPNAHPPPPHLASPSSNLALPPPPQLLPDLTDLVCISCSVKHSRSFVSRMDPDRCKLDLN